MKKYILLILSVLAAACSHDALETVDFENKKIEIGRESPGKFTVLRESDLDLNDSRLWGELWDYRDEEQTKATSTTMISSVSGILSSLLSAKVHQVVGTYTSIDIDGSPVTISGKLVYPTQVPIKNIILVSHYTIGSNAECPSEMFQFESMYAALGYAVVISDYIGFGVTVDRIHPYLQADVTAANVIDMGIAVRPFLESRNLKPQSDEVILVGYSQGGATSLHVQRLLESVPEYMSQFKIKKNYAGSGPYDIARTYDYCINKDIIGIPCAVPMIIQGMNLGMDKPLEMSYFFQEPLLSNYDDWLNSKRYTVMQINAKIGTNKLSDILTTNATDRKKEETARFYRELVYNSIQPDFFPEAPLYMFHSQDDETVPFVNSQVMQRQFRELDTPIEYDFGHYGSHQKGAIRFIFKVAIKLKEDE